MRHGPYFGNVGGNIPAADDLSGGGASVSFFTDDAGPAATAPR